MSELPKDWKMGTLRDLARVRNGYAFKSSDFIDEGVPLIRQSNLVGDTVEIEKAKCLPPSFLDEHPRFTVKKGDVLIGMSGSIGKLSWYRHDTPALQNQRTGLLEFEEPGSAGWVCYFLNSVERQLNQTAKGVAVQNISGKEIEALSLPLPPLREQRRIVARIEELFSRLDAGVAALRHAKAQLHRYRQSVLAAAVTGQLTQAWRERHPQGEPATEMLGDLLDRLANGTTAEQSKEPPGIPVSRIETISNATINYKRVRYVREIDREKCAQFMVRDGDILFSHINSDLHLGKTAVAIGNRELLHGMNLLLMRPCERINAKYLNYVLTHLRFSGYFMSIAQHAVNQSSLNQKKLMAIPIPVPAIAEQRQVVAEVEARTTAIDHLEAELDRQITRSNRLRQSILASAFSGAL